MQPRVMILVSRTHWRCVSCRLVSKHAVSIDQHLQKQHSDLLSPMTAGSHSSLRPDSGCYSDGELEGTCFISPYKFAPVVNRCSDFSDIERRASKRKKSERKSGVGRKLGSKGKRGNKSFEPVSVVSTEESCIKTEFPEQYADEDSEQHEESSPPKAKRTKAASKQMRKAKLKQTKEPPGSKQKKTRKSKLSSSDFGDDPDYEPLIDVQSDIDEEPEDDRVQKNSKKKSSLEKISTADKKHQEPKSISGKGKRGRKRKVPNDEVDNSDPNVKKQHRKTTGSLSSRRRGRKSKSGWLVKKPGSGGKPVTRSFVLPEGEKTQMKDSYVSIQAKCKKEMDTENGQVETSAQKQNAHVPNALAGNQTEMKPQTAVKDFSEGSAGHEIGVQNLTTREKNVEHHEPPVATASRPALSVGDRMMMTSTDAIRADQNVISTSTRSEGATDMSRTGFRDMLVPHAHLHGQNESFHQQYPLSGVNMGIPGVIQPGVSNFHIQRYGCLPLIPGESPFNLATQQAPVSYSSENRHPYFGETVLFSNDNAHFFGDSSRPQVENIPGPLNPPAATENTRALENKTLSDTKPSVSMDQPVQIFECTVCQAKFSTAKNLADHEAKLASDVVSECKGCQQRFHSPQELNLHVFHEHERKTKPFCFQCTEQFQGMAEFEQHLHHQHQWNQEPRLLGVQFHACQVCKDDVICKNTIMKKHYYKKHKLTICEKCFIRSKLVLLTDHTSISEHRKSHANFCNICFEDFPTAESLQTHLLVHTHTDASKTEDGKGEVCKKCSQWCPNQGSVVLHRGEHVRKLIREWRTENWDIHCKCVHCDKVLRNKRNLQRHIQQQHTAVRTYKFHCEFCGKGFDSNKSLQDHIAVQHLGIMRYNCQSCTQGFANPAALQRHVLKCHDPDKQFACPLCDKKYLEKHTLKRHMSVHDGCFRLICEQCGKAFHSKSCLRKHVLVHAEKQEFICQWCWQGYKREEHLRKHVVKCPKYLQQTDGQFVPGFSVSI